MGWVNPYNFVSLPAHRIDAEPPARGAAVAPKRLSGRIGLRLVTHTPFYTGASDALDEPRVVPLLRGPNGEAAIPGDAIRGAVRAVAEALSSSCVPRAPGFVVDKDLKGAPTGRYSFRKMRWEEESRRGLLERDAKGEWSILMALSHVALIEIARHRDALGEANDGELVVVTTRQEVLNVVPAGGRAQGPAAWWRDARIAQTGEAVEVDLAGQRVPLTDAARPAAATLGDGADVRVRVGECVESIRPANGTGDPAVLWMTSVASDTRRFQRAVFVDAGGRPLTTGSPVADGAIVKELVYKYTEGNDVELIRPTDVTNGWRLVHYRSRGNAGLKGIGPVGLWRQPYGARVPNLIPVAFHPCGEREIGGDRDSAVCWCCAIFGPGTTRKETKLWASSVDFGEARGGAPLEAGQTGWVRRRPLGAPQPSAQLFYLTHTEPRRASYDQPGTTIRGRKRYWHHPHATDAAHASVEPGHEGDQFCPVIETLEPDHELTAELSFQNLRPEDIGLLLAALDPRLLVQGNRRLFHKLGGGKPLGLGSVEIEIACVELLTPERYRGRERFMVAAPEEWQVWIDAFAASAGQDATPEDAVEPVEDGPWARLAPLREIAPEEASGSRAAFLSQRHIQELLALLDFDYPTSFSRLLRYPPGGSGAADSAKSFKWFVRRGGNRNKQLVNHLDELDPLASPIGDDPDYRPLQRD